MYNVAVNTSAFANMVTPFSPVGKQAVGLESPEAREEAFAPVEEPASNSPVFDKEEAAKAEQQAREQIEERQQREQQRRDQEQIQQLANRDREVRAHEQAHASVGGQYAGSPSFSYERGPDGVNYAVGGEVPISLPSSSGKNPEQTLAAAEQVRRAALAPADPSPQDRSVAASASQLALEARAEIAKQQVQETVEAREQGEVQRQQEAEKEEQLEEEREEAEAREQRLEELRALSRRSTQLSEQLVTLDSIQRDQNIGSVLDQLA